MGALKRIFQGVIFGNNVGLINEWFNIDIAAFSNKIQKYPNGININNQTDLPDNKQWLDLLVAQSWNSNEDETFKDIITDCISIMMMDPNYDMSSIGMNVAIYLNEFNKSFVDSLETEARYRFKKFWINPAPKTTSAAPPPIYAQPNNQKQTNEGSNYRIQQQTKVNVASPTLPDL